MRKHYSVHIFERINLFRCCLLFKESSRVFLCCALRNICWTIWFELGAFPLSLFLAICQFLSGGFYCLEAICMCIFGSYILVGYLFSLAKNGKTHLLKLDPSKYQNSAHWTAYAILVIFGQFLWTQIEVKKIVIVVLWWQTNLQKLVVEDSRDVFLWGIMDSPLPSLSGS